MLAPGWCVLVASPRGLPTLMDFPAELFEDARERDVILRALELFDSAPVVLTDKLTNSIYFNGEAEKLFGERAEAIVNRTAASLLGFGKSSPVPTALTSALLGEGGPWKAVARLQDGPSVVCEASAIRRENRFVCGLIRLSMPRAGEV